MICQQSHPMHGRHECMHGASLTNGLCAQCECCLVWMLCWYIQWNIWSSLHAFYNTRRFSSLTPLRATAIHLVYVSYHCQCYIINDTQSMLDNQYHTINVTQPMLHNRCYTINVTQSMLHNQCCTTNVAQSKFRKQLCTVNAAQSMLHNQCCASSVAQSM